MSIRSIRRYTLTAKISGGVAVLIPAGGVNNVISGPVQLARPTPSGRPHRNRRYDVRLVQATTVQQAGSNGNLVVQGAAMWLAGSQPLQNNQPSGIIDLVSLVPLSVSAPLGLFFSAAYSGAMTVYSRLIAEIWTALAMWSGEDGQLTLGAMLGVSNNSATAYDVTAFTTVYEVLETEYSDSCGDTE